MKDEQVRHCPRCNSEMYHDVFGWYCSNPNCGYQIEMRTPEEAQELQRLRKEQKRQADSD